jgi:hypothetical protein
MMTSGAKRSSTARRARRILPSAERRLRASFPEVWAWYELLVAARGADTLVVHDRSEERPRRTSVRR